MAVSVAATARGIYSLDQSGTGMGAVLHANYSVVTAAAPAARGETVLVFLTGMGAVSPPIADGTAGKSGPLRLTNASPLSVLVAGQPANIVFNGLAPGLPRTLPVM
jgi:uncharacterized protein (TIGR03437 family)